MQARLPIAASLSLLLSFGAVLPGFTQAPAFAQSNAGTNGSGDQGGTGEAGEGGAGGGLDARSGTATPEQLSEAQAVVSRGERLSTTVTAMKTEAERDKDIIRVNCLNTTLAEVNANLRSARDRLQRLRTEVDPDRVRQAITVLQVYNQKFSVLEQQASQCIGQNMFETGQTKVETTVDNTQVPTEDEAQATTVPQVVPDPEPGQVVVEAPPTPQESSPNGDEG